MSPDERLNSLKRLRARASEWSAELNSALNYKASEVMLAQMRLDQHYVAEELAALDAVIEGAPTGIIPRAEMAEDETSCPDCAGVGCLACGRTGRICRHCGGAQSRGVCRECFPKNEGAEAQS